MNQASPNLGAAIARHAERKIMAWRRENGRLGVRNHVAILPLDDISNAACEAVAAHIQGTLALPHAYGRLQFGEDLELHFRTMIGTGANPNVAACIVIGIEAGWTTKVVDRMLAVGIKGVFWSLQAATPYLIKRRGSVINLSSVAVSFSIRNSAVYTSIKGAVDALTRQQAAELGEHGVRVNAIAPGPVETPGANSVIDQQGWNDRRARTPLKRLAGADEVAAAALFLASDAAASITGVTLKIDAGITVVGP